MRHNRHMKYFLLGLLFLVAAPAYAATASVSGSASVCTMEYAPVCGYKIRSDNQCVGEECKVYQTYSNQCMLGADGAKFAHSGECTGNETDDDKSDDDEGKGDGEVYTPPQGCVAWYDGCNSCSMSGGGAVCTLRACFRMEPGYCTMWDEKPIPVEPDGGIGDTPTPPIATDGSVDGEVVANDTEVGFFTRIWLSVLSWF